MQFSKKQGFGLIEVLIALAIMAVGLLAVGTFQSSLVTESAESKAKAEAIALAQARIEELRNYTGEAKSSSEFDVLFVNIADGNQTTHTGTNATFTRSETIADPSSTKELTVVVAWVDAANESQQIQLKTEMSYESPSLAGEMDNSVNQERLVRSATGRAKLGEGQVESGESPDVATNGDLTGLLDRGDGDLRLTLGDDVVLTLIDACELGDDGVRDETDAECTGFVEISGRVYVDTAANSGWQLGEIYVKASDAAFCQRYYTTIDPDTGASKPVQVDFATTSAYSTANGDYLYYDYTCYLGGGWHGNIGVVFADGAGPNVGVGINDKVCQGDPTAVDAFADPRVASRRVYRGMTYLIDPDTGLQEVEIATGLNVHYSIGVADALVLPDPNALVPQAHHDFVVTQLNDNDGSSCIGVSNDGPMMRTDANVSGIPGDLFRGVPTDFYCLNTPVEQIDGSTARYYDQIKMDVFGFSIDSACPFDPSDPPSTKYAITGTLKISAEVSDTNKAIVDTTWFNTSDGVGNCTYPNIDTLADGYSIDYSCTVYDWPDSDTPGDTRGWNGYVQINPDLTEMSCVDLRNSHTAVKGDIANSDFACNVGSVVYIKGEITKEQGARKGITDISVTTNNGVCNFDSAALTYECASDTIPFGGIWTGTITYTTSGNYVCLTDPSADLIAESILINDNLIINTLVISNSQAGQATVDAYVSKKNECPVH